MGTGLEVAAWGSVATGAAGLAMQNSAANGISAPPPRDYYKEMAAALNAQERIYPRLLSLEKAYVPQFQDLQKQTLMGQLGVLDSLYGQAIPMAARLGQQGVQAMSPVLAGIGTSAMGAYNQMLGPQASGILNTMQQQATNELSLGRSLSPEEQMYAQQAARAASQARGMGYGNQAVASEVLNEYNLANAREMQRRSYAANVYGMQQQAAHHAYSIYGQPLTAMIGTTAPSSLIGTGFQSQAGLGPSIFNPESQYQSDIIGANQQNQMSTMIARQQARSGMGAGLMSLAGSIGGAAIGNENFGAPKQTGLSWDNIIGG